MSNSNISIERWIDDLIFDYTWEKQMIAKGMRNANEIPDCILCDLQALKECIQHKEKQHE